MPILLEDLAEEASAGNRRVASRLAAEARDLDAMRQGRAQPDTLRRRALESARQATHYALSQLAPAERMWQSGIDTLRDQPFGDVANELLGTLLRVFESGLGLVASARVLWEAAGRAGVQSEGIGELDRAAERFEALASEARRAIEHRTQEWQPADPERLAQGLKLAREGKAVTADEARERFRQAGG